MKKLITLIFSLLITFNVLANDWPHQNISKAVFALDIIDRAPIKIIEEHDNSLGNIYFFTNILNLQGQRVTHRWIYNNKVMADVVFDVGGPRWRVWSSKNLWPTWIGVWSVEVLSADGEVLYQKELNYKNK